MMRGPSILARTLSQPSVSDKFGNTWQYHSRSDRHSKIACWTLLFDLLDACPLLVNHASTGLVGFGINHTMRDFRTGKKKDLDLVLCTPGTTSGVRNVSSPHFVQLREQYGIEQSPDETTRLEALPILANVPVGMVHVAMEAKATMTEHIKALPRLFDELNSSHQTIHGASDSAIAAGFVVVNIATTFLSPGKNEFDLKQHTPRVSTHRQPRAAECTLEKIREIPRRSQIGGDGFDALGILVIELANDGSMVRIVESDPAPRDDYHLHYDQFVRRIAAGYEGRFRNV